MHFIMMSCLPVMWVKGSVYSNEMFDPQMVNFELCIQFDPQFEFSRIFDHYQLINFSFQFIGILFYAVIKYK